MKLNICSVDFDSRTVTFRIPQIVMSKLQFISGKAQVKLSDIVGNYDDEKSINKLNERAKLTKSELKRIYADE